VKLLKRRDKERNYDKYIGDTSSYFRKRKSFYSYFLSKHIYLSGFHNRDDDLFYEFCDEESYYENHSCSDDVWDVSYDLIEHSFYWSYYFFESKTSKDAWKEKEDDKTIERCSYRSTGSFFYFFIDTRF